MAKKKTAKWARTGKYAGFVSIQLSTQEKAKLRIAAALAGKSIRAYVKDLVVAEAEIATKNVDFTLE